jgi:hypothetical protein
MTIETVIFVGSSLRPEMVRALLPEAHILPPARQGDIYRVVRDLGPRCIGLIDGVFLHVPAVWHREILWAMDRGTQVFGAASMGALRAAELACYGMVGVGKIFAAYRDGCYSPYTDTFEDDDEVAVIHAPPEAGGEALCTAMVDLRETLASAECAGVIDRGTRDDLVGAMKNLYFPQRSFAALTEAASARLGTEAANFAVWLAGHRVSQKALDAVDLLQTLSGAAPAPPARSFRFEPALVWERFVADENEPQLNEEELAVLVELGLDPAAWLRTARRALGRLAVDKVMPRGELRGALDRFRRLRGLSTRVDLEGWLAANALSPAALERLLGKEAALDESLASIPIERQRRAMVDQLRIDGDFAALLTGSREKRQILEGRPNIASGPSADGALAWYFSRLEMAEPRSLGDYARSVGFAQEVSFRTAVWQEYQYVAAKGREQ